MRILSHRGLWAAPGEKNTAAAFARSFEAGFGAEIDVRDEGLRLVVSHDPSPGGALPVRDVLDLHRRLGPHLPLAFNVKACGLARALGELLREYGVTESFVFDMAVPDALDYLRRGLPAFTRQSEYETEPAFYTVASGVWIDGFLDDWIGEDAVSRHLSGGKAVCLVSPELHERPYAPIWDRWAGMSCVGDPRLSLCTDHPEAARRLFGG
jgi:hypothetical protein